MRIGIIGGTGYQAYGLALRWARSGHMIWIGSRSAEKAGEAVERLTTALQELAIEDDTEWGPIRGVTNEEACREADVIVLTVPAAGHAEILSSIQPHTTGKIVVDVTVTLDPQDPTKLAHDEPEAAAVRTQRLLGPEARVVAAWQTVSAPKLKQAQKPIDTDVLVCGDDAAAKQTVIELTKDLGGGGFDAGPLANAGTVEALTPLLIGMCFRYRRLSIGLRLTGI